MTSVHDMLWRITWPSLRTKRLVETPTLAVCGAIGFPTSAPTEFIEGNRRTGRCNSLPVTACTGPNIALVEVLLPDSATPIQPRMGAIATNSQPTFDRPYPSEVAMPVNTKT